MAPPLDRLNLKLDALTGKYSNIVLPTFFAVAFPGAIFITLIPK